MLKASTEVSKCTLFYKKLRSGLSTQSFLIFGDFEYSKFLNNFFMVLWLKTNNDTFKCGFHLITRVCTKNDSFLNMCLSQLATVYSKL